MNEYTYSNLNMNEYTYSMNIIILTLIQSEMNILLFANLFKKFYIVIILKNISQ